MESVPERMAACRRHRLRGRERRSYACGRFLGSRPYRPVRDGNGPGDLSEDFGLG
jgi:hypothetical protein